MNCYYVDYENVNNAGLRGIESLNKHDMVNILYSENADTLKFSTFQNIRKSNAKVECTNINCLGKNALDFQLCVLLGTKIGRFRGSNLNLYIVSKDTGYDSVKDGMAEILKEQMKQRQINLKISRVCTILDAMKKTEEKNEKKDVVSEIVYKTLSNTKYQLKDTDVIDVLNSKDVKKFSDFHNQCIKKFGNKDGKEIYQLMKPHLKARLHKG